MLKIYIINIIKNNNFGIKYINNKINLIIKTHKNIKIFNIKYIKKKNNIN